MKFSPNRTGGHQTSFYVQTPHEYINAFAFLTKYILHWKQADPIDTQVTLPSDL